MADIKLFLQTYSGQEDDQDDDDYSRYYESSMMDQANPDDLLSPLEKLRKYCTSENIFTRQMVARSIVETVQSVTNEQECFSLLEIITKLSDDLEPSVRCELMEQLPSCCMVISDLHLITDAIPGFIIPVMVKYLTDTNNQVRKLSQNALLQLMDQQLIHRDDVETQICPIILKLTESGSGDDFRTEAVGLMTKITSVVGSDASEKLFLERFADLCSDPLFHVRKVCASNFGEFTSVVKQEATEQNLLPLFTKLCEDGVWGVRKACAETFMAVSGTCSRDVKYDTLAPLFVGLLCDKSRWVQMAAYQALGQFITTFADCINSGYTVNDMGELLQVDIKTEGESTSSYPTLESDTSMMNVKTMEACTSEIGSPGFDRNDVQKDNTLLDDCSAEQENSYNNFEYWRTPIVLLDILEEIKGPSSIEQNRTRDTTDIRDKNTSNSEAVQSYVIIESSSNNSSNDEKPSILHNRMTSDRPESDVFLISPSSKEGIESGENNTNKMTSVELGSSFIDAFSTSYSTTYSSDDSEKFENTQESVISKLRLMALRNQRIVPPSLLEHYLSMTETSKAHTIDGELPRHCAFTLPGVALTLGRKNWHCLKQTYECLSTDMQWKVRRTLAFSIHDLALILGEEICVADLVPVFNAFLKDLDEVRIGVLKHLYQFINLLPKELQKDYLPVFREFQSTDNTRNWRFRQDLAQQLMNVIHLYNEEELAEYICPVALDLVCDKVAEVRENAFHLLCLLMQRLCSDENGQFAHKFPTNIITLGTHHQHWVKRKACAQIYLRFLEGHWSEPSRFAKDFLPSLLNLTADIVPNVRLITSKAILAFIRTEYYQSLPEDDETRKLVDGALESLQNDEDRDVRFFSGGNVEDRIPNDNAEVDNNRTYKVDQNRTYTEGEIRMIQRGIHEYALNDDEGYDDDDNELVEEVYISEQSSDEGNCQNVVEEYFTEPNPPQDGEYYDVNDSGQVYVEEIIEEIVETVGKNANESN